MRKFLSVQLCDDYEASQLNPVYADTPGELLSMMPL